MPMKKLKISDDESSPMDVSSEPPPIEEEEQPVRNTRSPKINKRFRLSANVYLTFGIVKEDQCEILIQQKNPPMTFNIPMDAWDTLYQRWGPVYGFTTCPDESVYTAILMNTEDTRIKVASSQGQMVFGVSSTPCGHDFSLPDECTKTLVLTRDEARELHRFKFLINQHTELIEAHGNVFHCMAEAIVVQFRLIYNNLFGICENQRDFTKLDEHKKFDQVEAFFGNYVSPYYVISNFHSILKREEETCQFQPFNVYMVVLGQKSFLKNKF